MLLRDAQESQRYGRIFKSPNAAKIKNEKITDIIFIKTSKKSGKTVDRMEV